MTDILLFADDTTVVKGGRDHDDLEQTSEDAQQWVSDWFSAKQLNLNL